MKLGQIINILLIVLFFFIRQSYLVMISPVYQVNLLLLSGLIVLFLDYEEKAFWWFLLGGLFLDLYSPSSFGLNTIIFIAIYLMVSYLKKTIVHQPNLFLITVVLIGSVVIYNLANWLLIEQGNLVEFMIYLAGVALVNFIAIWPIYLLFVYLTSWLGRYKQFS